MDVYAKRLSGLKDNLVCHSQLGGTREFVYDTDESAFLKRGLLGFEMDRYY